MSIGTYPPQIGAVPIAIEQGGTSAITAPEARTNLGLGTMAQQDAHAVAITGGSAQLTGDFIVDTSTLMVNATAHGVGVGTHGASGAKFTVGGTTYLNGHVGVTTLSDVVNRIRLQMVAGTNGIGYVPSGSGGLAWTPAKFYNVGSGEVGSITSNDTATFYNTSSDARLKHAIAALTGALDRVRALRPISFLWNADGSPGEGFRADELQQHIPAAVTGEPDAINDDGSIRPQGVDHSKIVPHLTAALQELAAQVQALQAQVAQLQGGA